jgi:hypothetical protein
VASTAILLGSISIWPRFFNDISNNRLAQWLGAISYPLYLWHWPALVLPSSALGRPLRFYERLFCILLTIVLAHCTSKYIEEPIRHKKISGKKTYLFFASTTAISLVAGLLIASTSSSIINIKGTNYSFDLNEVVQKPIVYDDGCHVNYGESVSDACEYGDLTSKKIIVLYGDSHAAQWFPALEKIAVERKYKLVSLTKSACPAVQAPRDDKGAFKSKDCDQWRENSIQRIKSMQPVAVIMSGLQYYKPAAGSADRTTWWKDGQERLLKAITGGSKNLIYISDTPHPLRDIPSCLATNSLEKCNTTEKTPNEIIAGFKQIDPTSWFCSDICEAVTDGFVAYRDASHITVDASIALAPKLDRALKDMGIFS